MAVTKTPRKKPTAAQETEAATPAKPKVAVARKASPATKAPAVDKVQAAKNPGPKKAAKDASPAVAVTEKATKGKTIKTKATKATGTDKAPEAVAPKATAHPVAAVTAGLPPLAQTILTAIQEGRPVEFIFLDTDAYAPRTFEPRQLTFDTLSRAWYAWGWDRRYNAERHHRVDLLAEVNAVDGVGRAAQGPYAEGTPANQIGGWLGGDPILVKASLSKQWVFAVKQAPPAFPNFNLEDQGEGQALVTFSATDLRAIARWAMQFGDGLQVLEPARLVDRIKQVGAVWAGRERTAPAPSAKPRAESASEPHRSEPRHHREAKPEREARPVREARPPRETEREEGPSKGKPAKVEVIRFDRL